MVLSPGTTTYWVGWILITIVIAAIYIFVRAAIAERRSRRTVPMHYRDAVLAVLRSRWTAVIIVAVFAFGAPFAEDPDAKIFLYDAFPFSPGGASRIVEVACDRIPVAGTTVGCSFAVRAAVPSDPRTIPDNDTGWTGADSLSTQPADLSALTRLGISAPTLEVALVPEHGPIALSSDKLSATQRFLLAPKSEGYQTAVVTITLRNGSGKKATDRVIYHTIVIPVRGNATVLSWIGANFDTIKTIGLAILGAFGLFGVTKPVEKASSRGAPS